MCPMSWGSLRQHRGYVQLQLHGQLQARVRLPLGEHDPGPSAVPARDVQRGQSNGMHAVPRGEVWHRGHRYQLPRRVLNPRAVLCPWLHVRCGSAVPPRHLQQRQHAPVYHVSIEHPVLDGWEHERVRVQRMQCGVRR